MATKSSKGHRARRDDNLRSGHRAEDLAIVMLRQLGAVAQVRHQDDVGVDAIVTLFLRDKTNKRELIPSRSLYVQIKTARVETIDFEESGHVWLRNLELPYFVGRIDASTLTLELFSTHALWPVWRDKPTLERLSLVLDSHAGHGEEVRLGPPCVSWQFGQLESREGREQRDSIVEVIRGWCEIAQKAHQTLIVGRYPNVSYALNEAPSVTGWKGGVTNNPEALRFHFAEAHHHLVPLLSLLSAQDGDLVKKFIQLLEQVIDRDDELGLSLLELRSIAAIPDILGMLKPAKPE